MLDDLIAQVIEARRVAATLDEEKRQAKSKWEIEHTALLVEDRRAQAEKERAELALREAAVAHFTATGDKYPALGVEVKMATRLEYDPADALMWGYAHGVALQLNKPFFEKLAKAEPPTFVQVLQVPFGTIAANLEIPKGREG